MNTASIRAAIVERLGRSDVSISLASTETTYSPSGAMTAECRITVYEAGTALRPILDETYHVEWPKARQMMSPPWASPTWPDEKGEVSVRFKAKAKADPVSTEPGHGRFTPAEVRAWFSLDARPLVERFRG